MNTWRVIGTNEARFYELGTYNVDSKEEAEILARSNFKHLVEGLALRVEAKPVKEGNSDYRVSK